MRLEELFEDIEEKRIEGRRDLEVSGLAYDSRQVEPGGVFFCIKGLVTDGHLFIGEAARRGAGAVVIEREPDEEIPGDITTVRVSDTRLSLALCSSRYYDEPSGKLELVGVTGTNGKTTTAYLVESILRADGRVTGLLGTVENHVAGAVEPVTRTTPESLDLQRLLARMVDSGVSAVAMEVSSHALELERVNGCRFRVAAFTNLTQDHLDFHISLEEYFGAKSRLFRDAGFGEQRAAVINADDEFGRRLLADTVLRKTSFGLGRDADVRARDVLVTPSGNRFELVMPGATFPVQTKLQGRFNVYNCLAAAAIAGELGVGPESIAAGLETLAGVPGRFENINCGQPFTVIVDYAHTPDGISSVLQAAREVAGGRVIIVVGCGGDRDRSKRPLMGRVAAEMSDLCVITSDNPRGEDPEAIIEMILEGIRGDVGEDRFLVKVDRREAIRKAVSSALPGDLVVVAGKGHESGQIFADGVVPFDDRQVVRECLMEVTGEES